MILDRIFDLLAALTVVLSAHPKEFTTPQKKIVSRVLLKAREICDPVNDLLYDLAAEIALKVLAVKKFEGFLRGVEECHE